MFVMPVLKNVSAMALTIVSDAHKHVASVLKNVEEWQDKKTDRLGKGHFSPFSRMWIYYC